MRERYNSKVIKWVSGAYVLTNYKNYNRKIWDREKEN